MKTPTPKMMHWYVYITLHKDLDQLFRSINCSLHQMYMFAQGSDPADVKFFEEENEYWAPSIEPAKLYSQLSSHKYREIPRSQIRYMLGSTLIVVEQ